jgi:hypothetical protein
VLDTDGSKPAVCCLKHKLYAEPRISEWQRSCSRSQKWNRASLIDWPISLFHAASACEKAFL